MTPENISFLRFASCGALRNQVGFVRSAAPGKALQRTFAVDVLDTNARPKLMPVFAAVLALRPKIEREATGKAPTCIREIASDS